MVRKARKKPVEVEYVEFTGDNQDEILEFCKGHARVGTVNPKLVIIHTTEGGMTVSVGDVVIRGTRGEFYPCKPGPFADGYDRLD